MIRWLICNLFHRRHWKETLNLSGWGWYRSEFKCTKCGRDWDIPGLDDSDITL